MFGENAEVVDERRWSRTYRIGGRSVYASKFLTDNLAVSPEAIKAEWETWSDSEKLEFAKAYKFKRELSLGDEEILSLLMDCGDERVWVSVAGLLTKHSDRPRALTFLRARIRATSSEPKATFIRALETIGGPEALSTLDEFHDATRSQISALGKNADETLVIDFVQCCFALMKLKGRDPYLREIEAFTSDERLPVRLVANHVLRGDVE